ncbi:MAG: ATP-binding protein [Solirubrobacterales bacterium]
MAQRRDSTSWSCPKCGGDGFVLNEEGDAIACSCRSTRIRRARTNGVSSVVPRKYRGVSFDRAPLPEIERANPLIVREVHRFCDEIDKRLANGRGLWFMGDKGTGKTTLAMLASKSALAAGHSVAIYSVPKLLAEIRDTYDSQPGERSYMDFYQRLVGVDLLHLDDLGAEKQTDWVLEQLYSLVNERYEQERPIIVTTNLGFEQLEQQIGARTVSRLVEICGDPLPLFGEDRRIAFDPTRAAAS